MSIMLKLLTSLIFLFVGSESARILGVFPVPSISHQVVFRPLMLELAKRGHEVTVITTDPAYPKNQTPSNLTEIDVHDMSYEYWNKFIAEDGNEKSPRKFARLVINTLLNLVVKQIKTAEIQQFINDNKKIDLLFVESAAQPALIFSYIYNAPVIEFSSLGGVLSAMERVGAATHPLLYPNVIRKRIYNLTLWEKVTELHDHYLIERILAQHVHTENKVLKTVFGPDIPDLDELRRNVQMMFLNVHPIWDFNRPVPPNVVYLGGLHQKPQQEIPKDLKSYLDSSKNGVIYISFGTNVKPSMIPPEKLKILTDVVSQLPYDVLWKWDTDVLPGRSKNVRISKWLPQSDLLRHPKIKLFITQGGLQSTDEAITAGVPLIGVPIFADQWFNVEQYVKLNIGKRILIETLTEEELMVAIKTVIDDESYRQSIVKLRNIMHDQPQTPLERAVWWTEHVLRHGGGEHLRSAAAHMPWTEYYELELIFIVLAALVIFLTVTVLSTYLIISNIRYYMHIKIKTN